MSPLKNFEKQAIEILVKDVLSSTVLNSVMETGELVGYEYTGCGYFLTLRHPDLPSRRIVCDKPTVIGTSKGIDSGFIVFLENNQLTLECHSWGARDVPETYRDQNVQITAS